jgi:Arm DNA-binding domain
VGLQSGGLRATVTGKPAYVFQSVYRGKDVRLTIGSPSAWSIPEAQAKARELQRLIDQGIDPRQLTADQDAADPALQEIERLDGVKVGEVWAQYLAERKAQWGERHYADHIAMSKPGGRAANRGTRGLGVTVDGPMYPLLKLRLASLTPEVIEAWATK